MSDKSSGQRDESRLSNKDKMTIINLMIQFEKKGDFSKARDFLKANRVLTKEQLDFVDEVFEILQKIQIDENIDKTKRREYEKRLRDEVYQKLQISPEVIQEAKEQVPYKKELYKPELLCKHPKVESDKPFVQLVRKPKERKDCPVHSYQFAGRTYDIRKRGELFYMSTPNLQDSVSEYEITISTENLSKTIRVFGEISIDRMREPNYNTMVFLQLLGVTNLTDKELHGYIGSLEQVVGKNGTKKNEYRIAHLPEEYTAVVMWAEKEREQAKLNNQGKNVINLAGRNGSGRAVGGEER